MYSANCTQARQKKSHPHIKLLKTKEEETKQKLIYLQRNNCSTQLFFFFKQLVIVVKTKICATEAEPMGLEI